MPERRRRGLIARVKAGALGRRAFVEKLLALGDPPTAVFCYNDMSALGALGAIHARGLNVPGDLSIVGFDDIFFASFTRPLLTTIRQPMALVPSALLRLSLSVPFSIMNEPIQPTGFAATSPNCVNGAALVL